MALSQLLPGEGSEPLEAPEVVRLLETLCKDFLECIITSKTYEISMRHVDIKNLNKVRDPSEMTPA